MEDDDTAGQLKETTKDDGAITIEDVLSQENERSWVDTLLSCSGEAEEDFSYINKIVCNDWNQAATGWEHTIPNVRYAWGEPKASGSSKKLDSEESSGKRHKTHRHHKTPEEDSWRRCVEPRTFRYVYDPKGLHYSTLKLYSGSSLQRSSDDDYNEHIMKLREYLEKTLNHAKKETSSGIKEHAKLGQYFAMRSDAPSDKTSRKKGKLHSLGDRYYIRSDDTSSPEDQPEAPLTGVEGIRLDDGSGTVKAERQATPLLPFRKVTKSDISQLNKYSNVQRTSPRLKFSHGVHPSHSPVNSYEKFPTQSVVPPSVPDLTLSPLKKVTPHQRQIHDDNEVLSMPFTVSAVEKPGSAKSEPDHTPAYKVVLERSSAPQLGSRGHRNELSEIINGKAVGAPQPMKEFPLAQELAAVSKLLREQDELKNKRKGKKIKPSQPLKLGAGYVHGAGDSDGGRLGEPLHRGVMDRETAGAMAAELLPGVSGHKLNLPAYVHRIL